jgi:hypothetical protein
VGLPALEGHALGVGDRLYAGVAAFQFAARHIVLPLLARDGLARGEEAPPVEHSVYVGLHAAVHGPLGGDSYLLEPLALALLDVVPDVQEGEAGEHKRRAQHHVGHGGPTEPLAHGAAQTLQRIEAGLHEAYTAAGGASFRINQ